MRKLKATSYPRRRNLQACECDTGEDSEHMEEQRVHTALVRGSRFNLQLEGI